MKANEISRLIGRKPRVSWTVGEPRMTPKGNPLEGIYRETYCSFLLKEGPEATIIPAIQAQNERLKKRITSINKIWKTGGVLEYFAVLVLKNSGVFVLEPQMMSAMSRLHIRIALDMDYSTGPTSDYSKIKKACERGGPLT
jgi:hypothetical protein